MHTPPAPNPLSATASAAILLAVSVVVAGATGSIVRTGDWILHSALIGLVIGGSAITAVTITLAVIDRRPNRRTRSEAAALREFAGRIDGLQDRFESQKGRGDRLEAVVNLTSKDVVEVRGEIRDIKCLLRTTMDAVRGLVYAADTSEPQPLPSLPRDPSQTGPQEISHWPR